MTVTITLTSPGLDTGPFDLYSNVDSYAVPFQSGVSRSSLISGYNATTVPNAATTIKVKSNNVNCTSEILLSVSGITTTTTSTTTTTTTTACAIVTYGYDEFDPTTACDNYINSPGNYQWNGSLLFDQTFPVGCTLIAGAGYYSDGTDVWYWDTVNLTYDSPCPDTVGINFYAKRNGSVSAGNNDMEITISQDGGATWSSIFGGALTTTMTLKTSSVFLVGSTLLVGVMRNGTLFPLSFARGFSAGDSCLNDFYYCGQDLPPTVTSGGCGGTFAGPGTYDYGTITSTPFNIYLNLETLFNDYVECVI
jgi:hypothetical protein